MRIRLPTHNVMGRFIECEMEAEDMLLEAPCPEPGCKMGKVNGKKCPCCLGTNEVVTPLGVLFLIFVDKWWKPYKKGELPGWSKK